MQNIKKSDGLCVTLVLIETWEIIEFRKFYDKICVVNLNCKEIGVMIELWWFWIQKRKNENVVYSIEKQSSFEFMMMMMTSVANNNTKKYWKQSNDKIVTFRHSRDFRKLFWRNFPKISKTKNKLPIDRQKSKCTKKRRRRRNFMFRWLDSHFRR